MLRRNRKQKLESEDQPTVNGDQDNFFSDEIKYEMETMWEIPQIFHFLHLTRESLNIPQLSIYEMERMLLMPRASKQLANIMTCLLSSPITKAKLRKVPPMPYEFWTNILAHKMTSWFKVYHAKHKDAIKVLETIGVEPEFWSIFPDGSLLDGRHFEDLSFKQRVWLLKTVCDTIMHTRKTVQEDIAKQPWEDQFETTLGMDRYGARYVYFPQFISSDLRIYRHCLDNKILSTVRPVGPKQEMDSETNNSIIMKLSRYRKRKSQSHNSMSMRSNRRDIKIEDKDINNYKYNNDSATGSLISEDTNLSSTSICSNNNNISLDTINRKRCRSLSKTSEESMLSNAKSSGYDTTTSSDNKLLDDDESSQKMFKGFSNTQGDNCSIGIINEMLDDLRSEIDKERRVDENGTNPTSHDNNSESVSQGNFVGSCNSTTGLCVEILTVERDESDKSIDNLSSSSKTDDEKLNEIISAENSKLPENTCSKNIPISDNVGNNVLTSTSKSDDEKLSETKVSSSNSRANGEKTDLNRGVTVNGSLCASFNDSAPLSEEVAKCEHLGERSICLSMYGELNDSIQERNARKRKLRTRYAAIYRGKEDREVIKKKVKKGTEENDKTNDADDRDSFASDREIRLREAMEDDSDDYANNSGSGYNLRRSKRFKTDEFKHFNELLSDLSISTFQLVVDSVDGLRDLISVFSENDSGKDKINNVDITPLCEIKLVKKLTELLSSLEKVEITLKDATRKAKSKLQRERSNFKEGSVEDQDSSGEGGLSSNWWVLGSQGCPLSAPGDATLQTLPQPALSSFGSQNRQPRHESENESADKNTEQSRYKSRENDERRDEGKKSESETQGRKQTEKEGQKRESKQHEDNETTSNDEDTEQQTRRVLRARGVSSYTEQFYSDDESNQDELEEWTDVEAVYAAPGASISTSATYSAPKIRHGDNWSETEDSDQDWILPSSRKRKNKRPSANRRLKSFHHKLQNIKESTFQNNVEFGAFHSGDAKTSKNKSKDNRERKEPGMHTPIDSARVSIGNTCEFADSAAPKQTVPSMDAICKIETIGSMHSELDIKDEGPIYELNQYGENNYGRNPQQNYVMIKTDSSPMNYYMMPQNPTVTAGFMPRVGSLMQGGGIVSGIAPPIQQGYYVQGASNYVIQNPPNFFPIAQQQQSSIFQQQEPQMMAQPYINNTAYVPYVVATTQAEYNMIAPRPLMANPQIPQNPVYCAPRPQNKSNQQNRYGTPRQNPPYPNGAVIRSNAPVRGSCQRSANPRSIAPKGSVPRQRATNPKAVPRQKQAPSTSAENAGQKTTSLIVLSDSDDEIEMIITEKVTTTTVTQTPTLSKDRSKPAPRRNVNQTKQKPTITSDVVVPPTKDIIPPQIIERMNQGGISITPVKSIVPSTMPSTHTQLVVVVNETGSHYALALPNGSKLILTPEQVAQIRASNGGKLIL